MPTQIDEEEGVEMVDIHRYLLEEYPEEMQESRTCQQTRQ